MGLLLDAALRRHLQSDDVVLLQDYQAGELGVRVPVKVGNGQIVRLLPRVLRQELEGDVVHVRPEQVKEIGWAEKRKKYF